LNKNKQTVLPFYWPKVISVIIAIFVLLLVNSNFKLSFLEEISYIAFLGINFPNWIVALVFVILIAFILHYIVFCRTIKEFKEEAKGMSFKECICFCFRLRWNLAFLLVSSDYFFAQEFKEMVDNSFKDVCSRQKSKGWQHKYNNEIICRKNECEKHLKKKSRKLFVLLSNWSNVIFVSVLVGITSFIEQGIIGNSYKETYFAFLILHTLSRGVEIVIAFYKDVVPTRMTSHLGFGEKLSSLKRGNRISLAVHSYLEMTFLFGIIYFLEPSVINGIEGEKLLDYILYSFSVTAFNYSFDHKIPTFGKLVHVSQVIIGITLVVLSIANYIGMKDKMSTYEKSDWRKGNYI